MGHMIRSNLWLGRTMTEADATALSEDWRRAACTPLARWAPDDLAPCAPGQHRLHLLAVDNARRADRAFRTALLSAPGADYALGPFQSFGGLLALARLLLNRRGPCAPGAALKRRQEADGLRRHPAPSDRKRKP
jgi:hypothetical protein